MSLAPLSVVYCIGGILGHVDYLFSGKKRIRRMKVNISQVFGDDDRKSEEIVRDNLKHHIRTVLEFTQYTRLNSENIANVVSFERISILDQELKKGKGVILCTCHFGAKQLLQVAMGHKGYPVNQINYHMNQKELSFIQKNVAQKQRLKIEMRIPATFISAKGFLRSAFKCLKNNEVLIIAGDGSGLKDHMDNSYLPFDFLGKKMLFPSNMVSMARRTGASIVPVFVVREKIRHRIVFESPLNLSEETNAIVLKEYISLVEKYVRRYPSLWEFWEEFDERNLLADLCREQESCAKLSRN